MAINPNNMPLLTMGYILRHFRGREFRSDKRNIPFSFLRNPSQKEFKDLSIAQQTIEGSLSAYKKAWLSKLPPIPYIDLMAAYTYFSTPESSGDSFTKALETFTRLIVKGVQQEGVWLESLLEKLIKNYPSFHLESYSWSLNAYGCNHSAFGLPTQQGPIVFLKTPRNNYSELLKNTLCSKILTDFGVYTPKATVVLVDDETLEGDQQIQKRPFVLTKHISTLSPGKSTFIVGSLRDKWCRLPLVDIAYDRDKVDRRYQKDKERALGQTDLALAQAEAPIHTKWQPVLDQNFDPQAIQSLYFEELDELVTQYTLKTEKKWSRIQKNDQTMALYLKERQKHASSAKRKHDENWRGVLNDNFSIESAKSLYHRELIEVRHQVLHWVDKRWSNLLEMIYYTATKKNAQGGYTWKKPFRRPTTKPLENQDQEVIFPKFINLVDSQQIIKFGFLAAILSLSDLHSDNCGFLLGDQPSTDTAPQLPKFGIIESELHAVPKTFKPKADELSILETILSNISNFYDNDFFKHLLRSFSKKSSCQYVSEKAVIDAYFDLERTFIFNQPHHSVKGISLTADQSLVVALFEAALTRYSSELAQPEGAYLSQYWENFAKTITQNIPTYVRNFSQVRQMILKRFRNLSYTSRELA